MDFGIRELLMFIGALIFIGVLVDGVRRFQHNRKMQIKVMVDRKTSARDEDDGDDIGLYAAELPNGPARVKGEPDSSISDTAFAEGEVKAATKVAPRFTEPVDILMEHSNRVAEEKITPSLKQGIDESLEELVDEPESKEWITQQEDNEEYTNSDTYEEQVEQTELESELAESGFEESNDTVINDTAPKINQGDLFVGDKNSVSGTQASDQQKADVEKTDNFDDEVENELPEEILSVNVISKNGEELDGAILLEAVQTYGLRFGDMGIFHRHETSTGQGPVIFSMASAVNPGTFDIEALPSSHLKGVTFFMRLSQVNKRIFVLELMVDIAKRLSNQLGAELKDDTHSVLSSQTVTHYKSRIQEYERRYLGQVLRK